jgi:hypothetical protein
MAMNPNEPEQLTRFLNQLREVRVSERDTEADRLIREAVAANTDAAYLLVQRTMLMEQALANAKTQIAQLQQDAARRQGRDQGGFLGRSNPWAAGLEPTTDRPARIPGSTDYPAPRAAPAAAAAGGGSSFLGSIASTAAGVVAGSFLFQGIENLLGHHAAPYGFEATGGHAPGDTTVNNYYYGSAPDDSWSQPQDAGDVLADDTDISDDSDGFLDDTDDSNWA